MYTEVVYLQHCLVVTSLVPDETAAVSVRSVHHTTVHHIASLHASHVRRVYACLSVICHLHVWQHDRGLLRATAVTPFWSQYH